MFCSERNLAIMVEFHLYIQQSNKPYSLKSIYMYVLPDGQSGN